MYQYLTLHLNEFREIERKSYNGFGCIWKFYAIRLLQSLRLSLCIILPYATCLSYTHAHISLLRAAHYGYSFSTRVNVGEKLELIRHEKALLLLTPGSLSSERSGSSLRKHVSKYTIFEFFPSRLLYAEFSLLWQCCPLKLNRTI